MTARLDMISKRIMPDDVLNDNHRKAAAFKAQLESETDLSLRETIRGEYAEQLLLAGETKEAIRQYEKSLALDEKNPLVSPKEMSSKRMSLAVAYLRLGEQENCLLNHGSESCILPIQGGGIHQAKRGSLGAIRVLAQILQHESSNFAAGWLLNIAYMTLGEYPVRVPKQWLIPRDKFKSDYNIKRFHDIAGNLGLDLNQLSGGVIIEDFDNDGYLDVMISSIGTRTQLRLFHNNGDGTFSDRTNSAGLTGETGGLNIMQTDYNNDGFPDVLVLRGAWYGRGGHWPLSLLKNNGDGTFKDVTEEAGLLRFHPTQTAVWLDYNGDGNIDMFIGNESKSNDFNPCELFRNNGDGTFTECAKECGLDFAGFVKGVACADYNNDGRPDLFLSVQGDKNVLFRNDGPARPGGTARDPWKFTNVTAQAGVKNPVTSFSCFFFDFDNDGWPDLFVTGYSFGNINVGMVARDYLGLPVQCDYPVLYHNNHDGTFSDVSSRSRVRKLVWGMGINYGDLDNDGWLDFYVGTGTPDLSFLTPNRMFRNAGGKFFQDVTTSGGFGHLQKGHGIAFGDLNNDGSQDIYESMGGIFDGDTAFATLYENPGHGNHWLTLKLEGVKSNRAAIGARIKVTITEGGKSRDIYKTVSSGGSFGASPLRQEIGLGQAAGIQQVEVFWPATGKKDTYAGMSTNHFYKIREGDRNPVLWPLRTFAFSSGATPHHHNAAP